jgi:hypothetical protein
MGIEKVAFGAIVVVAARKLTTLLFRGRPSGVKHPKKTRDSAVEMARFDEIMERIGNAPSTTIRIPQLPKDSALALPENEALRRTPSTDRRGVDDDDFILWDSPAAPSPSPPAPSVVSPTPGVSAPKKSGIGGGLFKRKPTSERPTDLADILSAAAAAPEREASGSCRLSRLRFTEEVISNLARHLGGMNTVGSLRFQEYVREPLHTEIARLSNGWGGPAIEESSGGISDEPSESAFESALNNGETEETNGDSVNDSHGGTRILSELEVLRSIQLKAGVSSEVAAGVIGDAVNAMLVTLIDDAVDTLKYDTRTSNVEVFGNNDGNGGDASVERTISQELDALQDFIVHASKLFSILAPGTTLAKPVTYTGRLSKAKLEKLYSRCLELETEDEGALNNLQRVLGIKDNKAEQLQEIRMQRMMMKMMQEMQEDPEAMEAMADMMGGIDPLMSAGDGGGIGAMGSPADVQQMIDVLREALASSPANQKVRQGVSYRRITCARRHFTETPQFPLRSGCAANKYSTTKAARRELDETFGAMGMDLKGIVGIIEMQKGDPETDELVSLFKKLIELT